MKKVISILLVISLVFLFYPKKNNAYADALTISQIAGAAYAYGQSAGINWAFTNGSSDGAKTWLENEINSWLGGQSIAEVFGADIITTTVGKLLVPSTIALRIADFLRSLVTKFNIGTNTELSPGAIGDIPIGIGGNAYVRSFSDLTEVGVECYCNLEINYQYTGNMTTPVRFYLNGTTKYVGSVQGTGVKALGWGLSINELGQIIATNYYTTGYTDPVMHTNSTNLGVLQVDNQINASLGENYGYPDFPDVGYNWEGDIGATPDTNLDQLIGTIFENIADNNLSVEGEVVNPVVPPTPVPTFEPYPPVDDILPGINTGIEIGNDLISGQQTQTGAITQGLEGVQEAVGSLEGTLEAIADTPSEEELPDFKFDLRELFPFCIPFDIYRLLQSFDAEPVAPHVQLPFYIESLNFRYDMDLDFSLFNPVAQVLRTCELIVYALGLAWATGKVIKW